MKLQNLTKVSLLALVSLLVFLQVSISYSAIKPYVTENGKISLSIDGLGVYPEESGSIQVEKPDGATVRGAYLAAATTGFRNVMLADGDIQIDSVGVSWAIEVASSITSWNYWADVTTLVKPKIDAAGAGILISRTPSECAQGSFANLSRASSPDVPRISSPYRLPLWWYSSKWYGVYYSMAFIDERRVE